MLWTGYSTWLAQRCGFRGWRVSRIAVHEKIQRRGLGSRLLGYIEERARESGASLLTTMFSRHDVIPFWIKTVSHPST